MAEGGIPCLTQSVSDLRGVGEERARLLAKLNIHTVSDLLLHRPRRYEDRRLVRKVSELELKQVAVVSGPVVAMGIKKFARGRKSVFELVIDDGAGRLHCRWWNMAYMQNYFHVGQRLIAHGKVVNLRPPTIDHPETESTEDDDDESAHLNRVAPIYPLTEGLSQRWLRQLIWDLVRGGLEELAAPDVDALAPEFPPHHRALVNLHFPESEEEGERARERLALEEFLGLQMAMLRRRKKLLEVSSAKPCPGDNTLIKPFLNRLNFSLTEAQKRTLKEIRRDLGSGEPMRRLLQGDVGAGKTVVAACAALMTLESGCSVAMMAPTEILAEQHFRLFERWFEGAPISVQLRTGAKQSEEAPLFQMTTNESRDRMKLVIGTHALIEEKVEFENVGLVIIDEQHKFGVAQRDKLLKKAHRSHLLVMTATPIPRTLGLTIYGDLELSTIDELPGGRKPIKTFVRTPDRLEKVWEFVKKKLSEGRQAYVVYPRIEEGEQRELRAVTRAFDELKQILQPHTTALLHGRMKSDEKDQIMRDFYAGKTQALIATQIVEVGLDVPNATIMVIENAEQFGLAQLHQLRGRIGRGSHESYCVLIASAKTAQAQRRLKIMEQTQDGFRIAEEDLKLRGAGDFLGQDQSGLPPFRFADLVADRELAQRARKLAKEIHELGSEGSTRINTN